MNELIVSNKINSLMDHLNGKERDCIRTAVGFSQGYLSNPKPNEVFKAEDVKMLFDRLLEILIK